ncbi:MAG TPA: 2-amino-4-hydroxy-6-hydroxymethyldihydropteridine diphosphokinase [Povalibacter sp.]|uniref:2-amino-4-hydroxy-6- hydroxymethyldihydropteridine diphosphokinase n=1 Tax=Povalibacter sp. TaxID=1962978 RepID=UPI002C53A05C|nr:2-amino-4-hydroxy-6-hydroxymethyldihydropteridine diphosphokinase [Povalibacter sp.]HMN44628.1 2-amino-4-hydroxy-6-hydroxymethyldihydropteridine diphosphokinase [Povalibacter sp.]
MPEVFVAAGSNVQPEINLRKALDALERIYAPLTISPAYRNKAVGFEGEDFINLVLGFITTDSLIDVRRNLQSVEALCGRVPDAPKWAPRSMDLDILLYDDVVSDEPGYLLPRPDLVKRPYMLKPMADIAPDRMHPTRRRTMRELWAAFDQGGHEMKEVRV